MVSLSAEEKMEFSFGYRLLVFPSPTTSCSEPARNSSTLPGGQIVTSDQGGLWSSHGRFTDKKDDWKKT
ncbi:hypothetical protein CRYUN_Cryun25bG0060800 [Craigia yunnanensis]